MRFGDRENIYIHEAENVKIGGLFLFSPRRFQVMKNKSPFVGGSPEYWSTEQGAIFDTMRDSIKDPRTYSGFINTLPHITEKVPRVVLSSQVIDL